MDISQILEKMIVFSKGNLHDIDHFIRVWTYAKMIGKLENLESLVLIGSNVISNLSFLTKMKKLKTFIFTMEIADGDLTPCLDLQYACCAKGRKYYNLKDDKLPKGEYVRGNENIEMWRRFE